MPRGGAGHPSTPVIASNGERADAKKPLLNFFIERYRQSHLDELHDLVRALWPAEQTDHAHRFA